MQIFIKPNFLNFHIFLIFKTGFAAMLFFGLYATFKNLSLFNKFPLILNQKFNKVPLILIQNFLKFYI